VVVSLLYIKLKLFYRYFTQKWRLWVGWGGGELIFWGSSYV